MPRIHESDIELLAIDELQNLGYTYIGGPDLQSDGAYPERNGFADIVLVNRLRAAVARINTHLPLAVQEQAVQEVLRIGSPDMLANNEQFHRMLTEGIPVTVRKKDGEELGCSTRTTQQARAAGTAAMGRERRR